MHVFVWLHNWMIVNKSDRWILFLQTNKSNFEFIWLSIDITLLTKKNCFGLKQEDCKQIKHFGRCFKNKCFNVIFQYANWSGLVYIGTSFNIASWKTHDLGCQLTGSEREIKCSPNSPLNKSIVTRAVRHVAPSCCIHMSCNFCILGKEKLDIILR